MRSEDLLNFIGGVDSKFVDELMNDPVVPITRPRESRKRWLAVAACFAVIFLCTAVMMGIGVDVGSGQINLTGGVASIPMAHNAVVMIDVNPGIQMEVNDRGVVVKIEATNDDGAAIMDELKFTGMDCKKAISKTVAVMKEHGYITNLKNSILVSVANPDESFAEKLRKDIVDTIKIVDENTDYDLSVLSQIMTDVSEIAEIAESNHMSAGRAALIEKICKAHEEFAFDQLAKNNIQTINQLFEYISLPDKLFRTGTAAATVPEDCKDKLGLDGLSGEEIISFTHAISDFYDKLCDYYDESAVANRIGYAFDIACGKNEEGAKLWGVVAENLTNEYDSRCAFFSEGEDAVSDWYSNSHFKQFADYITSSLT